MSSEVMPSITSIPRPCSLDCTCEEMPEGRKGQVQGSGVSLGCELCAGALVNCAPATDTSTLPAESKRDHHSGAEVK